MKKFTDFYTAYHFLLRHAIFEGDYHGCLDVEVVKVDPSTKAIENDAGRNTETRVWFETGPSGIMIYPSTVEDKHMKKPLSNWQIV